MNIKRLIVIAVVCTMLYAVGLTQVNAADEQICYQVTQYSGGVGIVCGAKHEPVETGLADMNPVVLASIFFSLAGASLYKYKKLANQEIAL